jgi:hypothetical protein
MNINSELEKLISLRDRGDLSSSEFEKAKQILLSNDNSADTSIQNATTDERNSARGIPGLGLAIGVFAGNLIFISISGGGLAMGFAVGAIAAVLVVIFSLVIRAFRSK